MVKNLLARDGVIMSEQLSLFGEENTLFNEGIEKLREMDFTGCMETLDRYHKLFPWGRDISREMSTAQFWLEKLGSTYWADIEAAEAEKRYQFWLEFEETFYYPWPEKSIERRFQVDYFSRITDGLAKSGQYNSAKLPGGTPTGLMYLLAGSSDPAIEYLQELIAIDPESASVYGYLGDAYALRGDLRTARICYREAFVLAPDQVDLKHIQDNELKERLEELEADEMLGSNPLKWFAVIAQLNGFFEKRFFKGLGELKEWLQHYMKLVKAYGKVKDHDLVPSLFYHAMVISDNASMMKFIKKVDLVEVRQRMKKWHHALFARHMRELEKNESGSKGQFVWSLK
jgi:tetratricopeptide (TPR) repeat protein